MRTGLVLAVSVLALHLAWADDTSFYKLVASVAPLQNKAVQAELKVTESQRAALNKHADSYNSETKAISDSYAGGSIDQDQFRKKVADAQAALHDRIIGELTATQVARLGQITLQSAGIVALLSPLVADRLGMTEAQKKILADGWNQTGKDVAEVERKAKQPIVEKYKAMPAPKTDEERSKLQGQLDAEIKEANTKIQPDLQRLKKSYEDLVDKTLTAGQKKSWETLKGEPFKPSK